MKGRFITANAIAGFRKHLIFEERSSATVENISVMPRRFRAMHKAPPLPRKRLLRTKSGCGITIPCAVSIQCLQA